MEDRAFTQCMLAIQAESKQEFDICIIKATSNLTAIPAMAQKMDEQQSKICRDALKAKYKAQWTEISEYQGLDEVAKSFKSYVDGKTNDIDQIFPENAQ